MGVDRAIKLTALPDIRGSGDDTLCGTNDFISLSIVIPEDFERDDACAVLRNEHQTISSSRYIPVRDGLFLHARVNSNRTAREFWTTFKYIYMSGVCVILFALRHEKSKPQRVFFCATRVPLIYISRLHIRAISESVLIPQRHRHIFIFHMYTRGKAYTRKIFAAILGREA